MQKVKGESEVVVVSKLGTDLHRKALTSQLFLWTLTNPAHAPYPQQWVELSLPMDLFHAVTQSIDKVLTCHWYDGFKAFKMDDSKSKTMDTERGGESTQYVAVYLCFCTDLLTGGV